VSYAHDDHYKWIESNYSACSELGKNVANILGFVGRGIYNAPINHKKIEWGDPRHISVYWSGTVSNFDGQALTDLVLVCHAKMVRVTVSACGPHGLKFQFWQRHKREGSISERLPTIETMVEQFNNAWGGE
jgi:hypothetical protein